MDGKPYRILVLHDSHQRIVGVVARLQEMGDVEVECRPISATRSMDIALHERPWDLILYDWGGFPEDPAHALCLIQTVCPQTPVLIMADTAPIHVVVDLMRLGARDLVEKGDHARLIDMITEERQMRRAAPQPTTPTMALSTKEPDSEARQPVVLQAIPDLIFRIASNGTFLDYNAPDSNLLYAPPDEFVGKQVGDVLPPDLSQRVLEAIDQCNRTQQLVQFDYLLNLSGQSLDFEARVVPVGHGETLIITRNVTERKRSERALQKANDLLEQRVLNRTIELEQARDRAEAILNHSADGILLLDTEQGIRRANHAFNVMFGVETDTYVGSKLSTWIGIDQSADIDAVVQQIAETHAVQQIETRAKRSDGSQFDVEISIAPVNHSDNKVTNLVCIIRDIMARKIAQDALRVSNARSQALLEANPDLMFIFDRNGIYLDAKESPDLFISRDEIVGMSVAQIFPGEQGKFFLDQIRQVIDSGEPTLLEYEIHNASTWTSYEARLVKANENEALAIVRDITERKAAEIALRESETRYRLLAENIHDVIMKLSPRMEITFVTPSCYLQSGYTPEDLIGRIGFELVHPEDRAASFQIVSDAIQSGAPYFMLNERIQHKDGHYFWVELTNTIVRDPKSGEVIEFISLLHDINKRKEAEDALRIREAQYASVVQTQSELICRYQPDLTLTFINHAYCRYFNVTPEAMIGRSFLELIPESDHDAVKSFCEELVRTRGSAVYEQKTIQADGAERWQLWTDTVILDSEGSVAGIQSVGSDITERKQAEEALRASEEKFRRFVESAPVATIITDQNGVITLVNQEGEKLFGYARTELIGQPIELLVPESARVHHPAHRLTYMANPQRRRIGSLELQAQRKDGSQFWADIQLSYINTEANPMVMCLVLDSTARRLAEEALRHALAQEKELNELKSRFVSMTSHEFRTPLAAIMAVTETLTHYRSRMTDAQIQERLHKIRQQVEHMKEIMEDILQLARIQAGRVHLNPEQGSLDLLCEDIIGEFTNMPEFKNRIQWFCIDQSVRMSFDRRLMRQLVENLISNALKYSHKERSIQVYLTYDPGHAVLTVIDEGIGIPGEDLKRIFEPFHRSENVGTISGTGLGLSIAKQAVELHGGAIQVESRVGQGTTVTVTIPLGPSKGVDDGEDIAD